MTSVEEFRDYMNSINVSDSFTQYLLDILEGENTLQSLIIKIEILHSEGIDISSIEDDLMDNPFFVVDEPKEIENNIEVLKQYIEPKELTSVIQMNPDYLTIPENYFEQNLKMIKLLVSPETFEILLKAHGEIFTFNSDYLEKRLEFFIKNGFKERVEEFLISNMELFELEEDEINLEELY